MPASGRLWDSRLRRIVDSARSVSPWNTGFGNVIFSYPRFPIVVRKVRSGTIIPPISAAVNRLFTSRRPCGRWARAYSSSRWIGATFMVSDVNSTLSISVTVRVNGCENCAPSVISSKYSPRMPDLLSSEVEHRPAPLAGSEPGRYGPPPGIGSLVRVGLYPGHVNLVIRHPLQDLPEQLDRHGPAQVGPGAAVDAHAERGMPVRPALDVQGVRIAELRGVPVGRCPREQHPVAFAQRAAVKVGIAGHGPGQRLGRREVPQELLHRLRHLVRMLDQVGAH